MSTQQQQSRGGATNRQVTHEYLKNERPDVPLAAMGERFAHYRRTGELPDVATDGGQVTANYRCPTCGGALVDRDLPYHDIYDRQGQLYDGIDAPENRLVTIYDSEFDSLGAREISQFLFPDETNRAKEIEQRSE